MSMVLNSESFYREIKETNKLIVVDFFAVWCGPCKMLTPIFESLNDEFGAEVSFVKIDIENNLDIVRKYDIVSVPTMVMIKNGEEVDRIVGFVPRDQIKSKIKTHI